MSNLPTPGRYTIDPTHSSIDFVVRHLMAAKVRGGFTSFSGAVTVGETIEASSVEYGETVLADPSLASGQTSPRLDSIVNIQATKRN